MPIHYMVDHPSVKFKFDLLAFDREFLFNEVNRLHPIRGRVLSIRFLVHIKAF